MRVGGIGQDCHDGWENPQLVAKHRDAHAAQPQTKVYVQRCQLSPRRSGISTSSGNDLSPLTWKYLGLYFQVLFVERWNKQILFQGIPEFHFTTDSQFHFENLSQFHFATLS